MFDESNSHLIISKAMESTRQNNEMVSSSSTMMRTFLRWRRDRHSLPLDLDRLHIYHLHEERKLKVKSFWHRLKVPTPASTYLCLGHHRCRYQLDHFWYSKIPDLVDIQSQDP